MKNRNGKMVCNECGWGKVEEAVPAPDMAQLKTKAAASLLNGGKDPETGKPVDKKAAQDILKLKEAQKAKNPYAIGMAQAIKQTGDTPPLKKSTITLAHKMARKIEKGLKEQELTSIRSQVHALSGQFNQLKENHAHHVSTLQENWILREGDLQSAVIQHQMRQVQEHISELVEEYKQIKQELREWAQFESRTQAQIEKLNEQLSSQPYGVMGQFANGKTFRKFFENTELRHTWVTYNQDTIAHLDHIDPAQVEAVQRRLQDLI